MRALCVYLLALVSSGFVCLRFVTGADSYNNGGSCYDCQYAPHGLATTERGTWHVTDYSGFHRCALEQEDDAFYVNKWACTSERCFIRKDPNGQVFRGCADQWNLPWGIDTSSNCSRQGQSGSIWWFCDGHLCNDGFLHDGTRCGPSAAEPPKQDPATLLSYHNAPYYAPQHQEVMKQPPQPEDYPGLYEDESSLPTTAMTPSSKTEKATQPHSIMTEPDYEGLPLEYVVEEETVHGVSTHNNFQDRPLMPQPVYQDDPKNTHQAPGFDSAQGRIIDNTPKSRADRGIHPEKHPGMIYDYEGPAQPLPPSIYGNGEIQRQNGLPPVYGHGSIPPLNYQPHNSDHMGSQLPNKQPLTYDHEGMAPVNHQPQLHDNGALHTSKLLSGDDQGGRNPPSDSQPQIYDHGGLYPTNVQPQIIDNGGIPPRPVPKKPNSGRVSPHLPEPFWIWWWHSGVSQRMTPQQAYARYLDKYAETIRKSNRVAIGGAVGRDKSSNAKSVQNHLLHLHYPSWYSHHRQYEYAPIRSNFYYSRITRRRPPRPNHNRKQRLTNQPEYKSPDSQGTLDHQEDASKGFGDRPIRMVKSVNPLDYKSFKPPHTHAIVEPLGPISQTSETELNSKNIKQSEINQDSHLGEKTEKVLSKQAFYDYYDNFKLDENKSRARGYVTKEDERNPCTMTCYGTVGTLHKDPIRNDRFIQCGPGSRYGKACKCCQPFYHICPEGTSFDSLHKVCSQAGSSTLEKARYKTLELY